MSEELKELVDLFGESRPIVSVCGDNLSEVLAEAKRQEEEFWSFVARERASLVEQAREEPPTLLEWLEREISEARETASYLRAKQERGEEYWSGWADALELFSESYGLPLFYMVNIAWKKVALWRVGSVGVRYARLKEGLARDLYAVVPWAQVELVNPSVLPRKIPQMLEGR